MLSELRVRELGVIAELEIHLEPGLTAITGETGAGKTLIVEALDLVCGGRADPTMVRSGAIEAVVEARFVIGDDEHIVTRVIPRDGRSRAELDGRMATASSLSEFSEQLVDLHGQHAHQSLLHQRVQREAVDRFAAIDLSEAIRIRGVLQNLHERVAALGGDDQTRARELDFLTFELDEIERAGLRSADEEAELELEEDLLAEAVALREASTKALLLLEGTGDDGAIETVGNAVAELAAHRHLESYEKRLRGLLAELADAAEELRHGEETFEEDPARLEEIRARRQLLRRLVRKHGTCLADVLNVQAAMKTRHAELSEGEEGRIALLEEIDKKTELLRHAEAKVGNARRAAAPKMAEEIEEHLHHLGLERARFQVDVPMEGFGDDIEFRLGANPGEQELPLGKVASGGELARAMLALQLVLSVAPPTLVFDEVDAGIGGEAALAVGASLAALGRNHQVLVVTHLPQVAAYADHQVVVGKSVIDERTVAQAASVEGEERLVELARMLSGQPNSSIALQHAGELMEQARATLKR